MSLDYENLEQTLEDFENWKIEFQMSMNRFNPTEEYVKHLQNLKNKAILIRALNFMEAYEKGAPWPQELIDSLAKILRDETE